jgi:hypothetical protein
MSQYSDVTTVEIGGRVKMTFQLRVLVWGFSFLLFPDECHFHKTLSIVATDRVHSHLGSVQCLQREKMTF